MKHPFITTAAVLVLFLLSQVVGLSAFSYHMQVKVNETTGQVATSYPETAIGARPDVQGASSLIYILVAIAIGTALLLLLIKFRRVNLWKTWFFLAVWMTIAIFFGVFINHWIALGLALLVALLKIFRSNVIIHNLSEIFMYSGIAILIAPLFSLLWVSVLLVIIAIYDFIAVNKSKHMVSMAKFQTEAKLFAGLALPYKRDKSDGESKGARTQARIDAKTNKKRVQLKSEEKAAETMKGGDIAILGGGDVAFPLIFAGVVMDHLVNVLHYTKQAALMYTFIIPLFACMALVWLFAVSKRGKFYPAMPAVALGCFAGFGVISLLNLLL